MTSDDNDENELDRTAIERRKQRERIREGFILGGALFSLEWRFIVLSYAALVVPALLARWERSSEATLVIGLVLSRLLELLFLFFASKRALRRLAGPEAFVPDQHTLVTLLLYGFGAELLFLPALILVSSSSQSVSLIGALLFIPPVAIGMRYFLYFFPIMLGYRTPREVLQLAALFTGEDRFLALKLLLPGIALVSLLSSIVMLPAPDGRVASQSLVIDLVTPLVWVISTYVSLGVCFILLPEPLWRNARLDPYRNARLATLEIASPQWFTKLFTPRAALTALLISFFFWAGNMVRAAQTPPHCRSHH